MRALAVVGLTAQWRIATVEDGLPAQFNADYAATCFRETICHGTIAPHEP